MWEYEVVVLVGTVEDMLRDLDYMGKARWELVSVVNSGGVLLAFFKRRVLGSDG